VRGLSGSLICIAYILPTFTDLIMPSSVVPILTPSHVGRWSR
jgi:hypothetical protein